MKKLMKCTNCGELLDVEAMHEVDGNYYCEDCFDELFTVCGNCGRAVPKESVTLVNNGCDDEQYVCRECLQRYCFRCDDCGNYYFDYHLWDRDDNLSICNTCSSDYVNCTDCNCIVHADDACVYNGDYYCGSCYDDIRDDLSEYVNDYGYKPEPEFLGSAPDNMYLGVELEVDKGNPYYAAEHIYENYSDVYLKHDGSLNSGFEIVSHPATLGYHINNLGWDDIMKNCLNHNMRSHDTRTCGLHIHCSRDFFGETQDEQDLHIAKLILLVNKFWDEYIVPFSRRNYDNLNRWAAKPDLEILDSDTEDEILDKVKSTKRNGRYQAINLQNEYTIEFRIFRGTLKLHTFIATLQFVDCICRFAKRIRLSDIYATSWSDLFIGTDYKELKEYLTERNI